MQLLSHGALIGSVLAGVAGAVILAIVTLRHGFPRRRDGDEEPPEHAARRLRLARVADSLAVLCFAVAASLGVLGLLHQSRVTAADGALAARVERLEARVGGAESEIHARRAPDLNAWEERLARLETRLGAMEERATLADRRSGTRTAGGTTRGKEGAPESLMLSPNLVPTSPAPAAAKPDPVVPASRSTPVNPERPEASVRPDAVASPAPATPAAPAPALDSARPDAPAPATTAQAAPVARREPAKLERSPQKPSEPSLGEKLRQDWEAIKRDTRRAGDDWREGWEQIRRLFAP